MSVTAGQVARWVRRDEDEDKIVARLRSKDMYEPVAAMWKLATIDSGAADEIMAAAQGSEYPFHRLVAESVCLWLAQDVEELTRRFRASDGESASHLVSAADKLNDPTLNQAVAEWLERMNQRKTT